MKKNELTLSCGPMPKLIDAALPESKSIENRLLIMKALAGVPLPQAIRANATTRLCCVAP